MFNLNNTGGKMTTPKKKWLVVEVITFSETSESRTLSKVADTFDQALKLKVCLEELAKDERTDKHYYIASDSETILNKVIGEHNESVENGTYYEKNPDIKKPEPIENGSAEEMPF
tara:strand:- start:192 stop:536 length:345 start_codon:yes stop_codon:yes gene_type:complete